MVLDDGNAGDKDTHNDDHNGEDGSRVYGRYLLSLFYLPFVCLMYVY